MMHDVMHSAMANAVRGLSMDGVEAANSGHPGLPMGMAAAATTIFTRFLKFDASEPNWADRDRFVLSAGHGSMLLYSLLYLNGYPGVELDDLKRFRKLGSKTPGHPEHGHTLPGIEVTTGPLGQGIAHAVGMALAERILAARYPGLVDHHTYVIASDGDLMEGISHEAISLAGHLRLSKMIVLWDDNGISIDGPLSLSESGDQVARFKAAGWNAEPVDGLDQDAVAAAIERAQRSEKPSMIACKTVIGFGAPKKAGTSKAHGEPLGAEELAGAKQALSLSETPFDVNVEAFEAWRANGRRGAETRKAWEQKLASLPADRRAEFERCRDAKRPAGLDKAISDLKQKLFAEPQTVATRKSSEIVLDAIVGVMPELILGSADLTPSNNTKAKGLAAVNPDDFSGRYIHYGIREHGMAAAMNGMTVHGGLLAAGGTFFTFSDYCRPAVRIAALMEIGPIFIMTHDSIGVGEDGPTHQPVEHLAAMRAMPHVFVYRPCDTVETAECWQLALHRNDRPAVLALTRQNLKQVRTNGTENRSAKGAYELVAAEGKAQASIFASGSEVEIAVEAQKTLAARGIAARIVSVPCMDLFMELPDEERDAIIGDAPVRVAVEAAVRFGWDAIIGDQGGFVGMTGFGASGKAADLYKHFGITADAVVEAVVKRHNAALVHGSSIGRDRAL